MEKLNYLHFSSSVVLEDVGEEELENIKKIFGEELEIQQIIILRRKAPLDFEVVLDESK